MYYSFGIQNTGCRKFITLPNIYVGIIIYYSEVEDIDNTAINNLWLSQRYTMIKVINIEYAD